MGTPLGGVPGVRSQRTSGYRTVMKGGNAQFMPGPAVIDGTKSRDSGNTGDLDVLRAGTLMGKVTSGGKWANSCMGSTGAAVAAGATSLTLSVACAVEVVRRVGATGTFKIAGPATAGGLVQVETVTYSAINQSTGVATITAIVNSYVTASLVMATDGSERFSTFIPDGDGIKVTDQDATSEDQEFPLRPVAGIVDASQLLPWPADTALQEWVQDMLNVNGPAQFVFDTNY